MRRLSLWMRAHPVVGDSVIALVLALLDLTAVASSGPNQFARQHPPAFWTVWALLILPVVARRFRPILTSYVILAGGALQVLTHGGFDDYAQALPIRGADLAIGVAIYTMVAYAGRRRALPYALCVLAGTAGWLFWRVGWARDTIFLAAACLMIYGFCWALGEFAGARKAYHREVEQRLKLLENERDQQARIAVAQERTRIARELHDVVAHAVSVIVVQADGAAYAMDADAPATRELARTAVRTISDTGREALGELRRLLEVLRSEGDEGGDRAPQPNVAALPELVDRVTQTGLPVWLVFRGDLAGLPAAVGLGIYRIVQEALTNTLKHAAAGSCAQVRVERVGNLIEVEVFDGPNVAEAAEGGTGSGLPALPALPAARRPVGVTGGNGLIGMRERATVLGGTLDAGPRPEGGWRVRATFPLKRREPDASLGRVIRVLLVDDQELMRMGFRMVLGAQPDIDVVGEAGNGEEAVALAEELRPDVVLMDVRMPVLDGVEATKRITEPGWGKVLVMTTFDLDEYALSALRNGAGGFLLKDTQPADLVSSIRAVASGDAVVSPSVTRRLLDRFLGPSGGELRDPKVLDVLTDREREVLVLIAKGLSNTEIAGKLYLSEATVKTHVGRILAKLDVRDRVQAVVLAYETGLVRPGTE